MTQVMPGKQVQGRASVHASTMLVVCPEILLGIAAWGGGIQKIHGQKRCSRVLFSYRLLISYLIIFSARNYRYREWRADTFQTSHVQYGRGYLMDADADADVRRDFAQSFVKGDPLQMVSFRVRQGQKN